MFSARYFNRRFFTARYWPKAGASASVEVGGGWCEMMDIFVPGFDEAQLFVPGATQAQIFVPGFDQAEAH